MNVLIIGGAGYIGSHQVRLMIENQYDVVVYDNLSTGHRDMVDPRALFVEGDIRNFELLKATIINNKIDAIMHFAALSLVGVSMEQPLEYYDNNVYGFQVLLKAMQETNVNKIIFSSTAATYGEHITMPIDETYSTIPTNTYGETKLAMEKMIKWVSGASDIKYVVLRYFNVAGAHPDSTLGELHNPETHLIPLVLQVALNQRDFISVYGTDYDTSDGTCIRDYIHVMDLCEAHRLALEYLCENKASDIFNLGYGHGFSVMQIIDSARKITQHKIPIKIDKRRSGDPAMLIASAKKAKDILKWMPKHDEIDTIISDAYNFHKQRR